MLDESEYFYNYICRHELIRCVYCPWGQIKIKVTQLSSRLCALSSSSRDVRSVLLLDKCKPQLKMAVQRVGLITNKKTQISECSLSSAARRSRPRISRGRPWLRASVHRSVDHAGTWPSLSPV